MVDFGIARVFAGAAPLEQAEEVWGSPQYISPEQADGSPPLPSSDVYSLGIVPYEMLAGQLPFSGDTAEELLRQHREDDPTSPRRLNPQITPELPIPEPVPQLHLDEDIVNLLLLGRDTARDTRAYRTDVIIIASINKQAQSVTMLTIPRDLFVYIPGWTMNRINTADGRGAAVGWSGGGPGLIKDTLLYNFGIVIHYYARVDLYRLPLEALFHGMIR